MIDMLWVLAVWTQDHPVKRRVLKEPGNPPQRFRGGAETHVARDYKSRSQEPEVRSQNEELFAVCSVTGLYFLHATPDASHHR